MGPPPSYRPHPLRRLRAFLLTDRVGHTIASVIGLTKVVFWWLVHKLRAPRFRSGDGA